MKKLLILGVVSLLFLGCNDTKKQKNDKQAVSEYTALQQSALSIFGKLPLVAESSTNPISNEKVLLGKTLFFDNRLSKDNTESCNTCHNLTTYGVDNLSTSPGNDGGFGSRNSPSVFNAALHIAQFWDGREPDVEAQAGGPMLNPVEMAMPSEKEVIRRLSKIENYQKLFKEAFPEDKNPISFKNIQNAIGAFERKLITPSKFDKFIAGDLNALTKTEKKGLQLFIDKGCVACHSGKALGGNIFQKFGVYDDYWKYTKSKKIDNGKYDVTKKETDKYVFKSASLRNVAKTYPYFHDGSVSNLDEAVKIMGKIQLNKDFTPEETTSIVAFLNSLTGELPKDI